MARSPFITALLNPINLSLLALSAAAGLCAAWWLFPVGLLLWVIMVAIVATDPALRRIQVMASRAPVAQRFQMAFSRLERTQASIDNTIADSPARLRPLLEPVQTQVEALVNRTHQLCVRMTVLENYRSVQAFNANIEGEIVRLDSQIATATDPQVKREYEESRLAVQKQIDSLRAISVQSDQVDAQLSSMTVTLSGMQAELVRLSVLGPEAAKTLLPAQLENLKDLGVQLDQFEKEISRLKS
jgi:hypothetical protein